MPTKLDFPITTSIRCLYVALNSIGAHLSAKLGTFLSDERTLTDELCDMFMLWGAMNDTSMHSIADPGERHIASLLPISTIDGKFLKYTQSEEGYVGADLCLKITAPGGEYKEALLQAKVLDPNPSVGFRCSNNWDKVRTQLADMRKYSSLAYLMIYVPDTFLNRRIQGIYTYEQRPIERTLSGISSKFGATLIHVDNLLDKNDQWLNGPPVAPAINGVFLPAGQSLGKLFLEMLMCNVGKWDYTTDFTTRALDNTNLPVPRFSLDFDLKKMGKKKFDDLVLDLKSNIKPDTLT